LIEVLKALYPDALSPREVLEANYRRRAVAFSSEVDPG
jgi:hypothetical protein